MPWKLRPDGGLRRWRCGLPEHSVLRPAVFLDRDGTVSEEVGYLNHVSRFRLLPCAAHSIRRLNDVGYPVFVVTNQSGVSRGYFPESLVHAVHQLMLQQLHSAAGAHLDGVFYCVHGAGEGCECRKPKIGMLTRAAREHGIDLAQSFVVGDRHSDIELARRAGARSIFVRTGYGEGEYLWNAAKWTSQPDFVAADLSDAVSWILKAAK
jgi:D-glycero-D-manno-heptose 1,7-bisphosphate phosphatase